MKKLIPILLLTIITISGCKIPTYTLGTSEAEFKSHKTWPTELAEATPERTVYKRVSGQENNHYTYLYYYFVDSKLVRIDQGEKKQTVIVKHFQSAQ